MHLFISVISATYLAACQASRKSDVCASTNALVGDSNAIVKVAPVVPAGGFVNVAGRSCTATFLLTNSSDTSLTFKAYTAQHCFAEDKIENQELSVSVHIPGTEKSSGGYLKNIKVTDDFYTRRSAFLEEVRALGSSQATKMAEDAIKIPLYADRGIESLDPNKSAEANEKQAEDDAYRRNVCISSTADRLTVANSQEVCWSALDTTVRILELKANQIPASQFKKVRRHLESKKKSHDQLLASHRSISTQFDQWSQNIQGRIGGWRLRNYTELPVFFMKEVCGKYLAKDDPVQEICKIREPLSALVKKYLVEFDVNGKQKSALDHANELGFGIDTPFVRTLPGSTTQAIAKELYPMAASDKFYSFMMKQREELAAMFPTKGGKILALPKQFSIAANPLFSSATSGMSSVEFGLIDSKALFGTEAAIPSKGVQPQATLRFYLPKTGSKVSFGPTDSGAMLTLSGVIPLLVLNTVDGNPTSGGSAVLALPEAEDDVPDISSQRRRPSANASRPSGNSADTRVNTADAMVPNKNVGCL